jgi:hypothetical protein
VFGLGSGVDCMVLSIPGMSPGAVVFGRTATMEADVAAALGEQNAALDSILDEGVSSLTTGIAGIRHLAAELPVWGTRDDAAELASYNGSCIEKFGNGGGNFRRMYAGFLEWAHELDAASVPAEAADLTRRSADQWTALAHTLWSADEGTDRWDEAGRQASGIADLEQELFERLARSDAVSPRR